MNVKDIISSFIIETWVSIYDAIEKDWILMWMWFVYDEMWLIQAMSNDMTYRKKIDKLKKIYIERYNKAKFNLIEKDVIKWIKESISNSIIWVRTHNKLCRFSSWLLTEEKATQICQKYSNCLNPLAYIILWKDTDILIKSIFQSSKLWLDYDLRKNWVDYTSSTQRYRKWVYLAKPWMFSVWTLRANILLEMYHPIVWYLLEINMLEHYLTDNVKKEISIYISNLKTSSKRNNSLLK